MSHWSIFVTSSNSSLKLGLISSPEATQRVPLDPSIACSGSYVKVRETVTTEPSLGLGLFWSVSTLFVETLLSYDLKPLLLP